ncbi:MAG TPA: hypothetical protein VF627_13530, partial [Abditibacterium sp.]
MEEIERLWAEHEALPFPKGHIKNDESSDIFIDFASCDTYASGCIDNFITWNGRLDAERITTLENCVTKLKILIEYFDEDDANFKKYSIQ